MWSSSPEQSIPGEILRYLNTKNKVTEKGLILFDQQMQPARCRERQKKSF